MIPSIHDVRRSLQALSPDQIRRLAELSGVPFETLQNVRLGSTANPGIETVRRFLIHLKEAGK